MLRLTITIKYLGYMKLTFLLIYIFPEHRGPWRNRISIFHVIFITCLTQRVYIRGCPAGPKTVTQRVWSRNPELQEHPKRFLVAWNKRFPYSLKHNY